MRTTTLLVALLLPSWSSRAAPSEGGEAPVRDWCPFDVLDDPKGIVVGPAITAESEHISLLPSEINDKLQSCLPSADWTVVSPQYRTLSVSPRHGSRGHLTSDVMCGKQRLREQVVVYRHRPGSAEAVVSEAPLENLAPIERTGCPFNYLHRPAGIVVDTNSKAKGTPASIIKQLNAEVQDCMPNSNWTIVSPRVFAYRSSRTEQFWRLASMPSCELGLRNFMLIYERHPLLPAPTTPGAPPSADPSSSHPPSSDPQPADPSP